MRFDHSWPMSSEGAVDGLVLAADGTRVAGATIEILIRGSRALGTPIETAVTGADGAFRFHKPVVRGRLAATSSLEFLVDGATVSATTSGFGSLLLVLAVVGGGGTRLEVPSSTVARRGFARPANSADTNASTRDRPQAPTAASAVDWLRRYLAATGLSLPNMANGITKLGADRP